MTVSPKTMPISCHPGDSMRVMVVATDAAKDPVVVPYEGTVIRATARRSDRHDDSHFETFDLVVERVDAETFVVVFGPEVTKRLEFGRMRWRMVVEDVETGPSTTTVAEGTVHPRR